MTRTARSRSARRLTATSQRDLDSRGADAQNANRVRRHLTPALATKPVALLTTNDLRHWRDGLVSKGVAPATINRTRAGLRAALELASSLDDRITNRNAFRSGLKGLLGGKNARRVVLPERRPRGCAAPICKLIKRTRATGAGSVGYSALGSFLRVRHSLSTLGGKVLYGR